MAYRRLAEDLETLVEHKSLTKKALERDKLNTETIIAEMRKKIEVRDLNEYIYYSFFPNLGSYIYTSFTIEAVGPIQVTNEFIWEQNQIYTFALINFFSLIVYVISYY